MGCIRYFSKFEEIEEYKDILETVLDAAYDGIVVVDTRGVITMINRAYEKLFNIPRNKAIGKHITEVLENSRMHIVAEKGEQEIGRIQTPQGREMLCLRIPIKKEGKIIGAIGKILFKDMEELKTLLYEVGKLETELQYYKDVMKEMQFYSFDFERIIGNSLQLLEVKEQAKKVAGSNSTILIRGESGTGKELFAHAIHYASSRRKGPLIKVNCSAIPENLLESELFGYEEGAFTGARKGGKIGKFQLAHGGSLFLDEIGDMTLNMQVKLLRVLQEKKVDPIGGNKTIPVDVRIIAATNRPLEELIEEEKFRLDLYYRLNVVELTIPPLRERKEDIPALIDFLLKKLSRAMGRIVPTVDAHALNCLLAYNWPGNIRELENVLERALNFIEHDCIKLEHLPYRITQKEIHLEQNQLFLWELLEKTEYAAIKQALKVSQGNKLKAAQILGISRASLYQKLRKYGVD